VRFVLGTPGELFSGKLAVEALPAQLTLTQIWFPLQALSWNYPAWTLSAEIPCYVLMTFVCLIAKRAITRWALSLAFIAVAVAPFLHALALTTPPYNVGTVPRAVLGFFIGFLLYDLWRWTPQPSGVVGAALATVLELAALAGFISILVFHFAGPLYLVNHLACAAMVFVYARDQGLLSKVVSTPPFLWLGKVSLSVYMFHGVVTTWLMLVANFIQARVEPEFMKVIPVPGIGDLYGIVLPQQWMNDALLVGYVVFVLVAAQFFYSFVEVPARDLFNRWARRVQGKPAAKPVGEPVGSSREATA
jgi:peptidoglycan/LPS O-acetylase OafA/YrhL